MDKTAKRHLAAIHAARVDKSNMVGIRKILAHVDRLRHGYSGNRSNATPADADALETALGACRPAVLGELHTTGLKTLRNPRYAKRFNEEERCIIESASAVFQLLRFDRVRKNRMATIQPVYRISDDRGRYFVFRNVAWQSGGDGPEVQGRDF
jgi:hypothetical protein